MDKDPYAQLAVQMRRLKQPLETLLATHETFVLQNMTAINNVKTLKPFRKGVERALESGASE